MRDGRVTVIVEDQDFCDTGLIADTADVTLVFDAFRQVETDLSGLTLATIAADLKDILAPTGVGCAGPEGREIIDGELRVACSPRAQSIDCERGLADVTLRAESLVVQRASGGFPCTLALEVNGVLSVDDRLDKETFTQTLRGFVLTESPGSNGATIITQDGDMSVDCLGALRFDTRTRPLTFPESSRCPVGGEIEVTRPPDIGSGVGANMASTLADDDGGRGGGTLLLPFRQRLFRAANGPVYQVLQNAGTDADKGADAIQITTLAGSLANAVDQCAAAAGPTIDPQAVTGAPPGQVLPLAAVFKSERIGDAGLPCFNGSSDGGDGRVCIGPDCATDCACRTADCATFGIGDGSKITAESRDVPRAALVPALDRIEPPCSDFTGFATWRFGASGPTTQLAQCAPAPADGFLLPVAASEFRGGTRGTTLVFAYDTPLLSAFNAGAAGFPIDVNGSNPVGCQGPDRVLTLGRAVLDGIPGPRIIYNPDGGVGFDFDGDGRIDKSDSSCRTGALAACQ